MIRRSFSFSQIHRADACFMTVFAQIAIGLALIFGGAGSSQAQVYDDDGLGRLFLSDLFLEPTYSYTEPHHGEFKIGGSYVAATWKRDRLISGTFKIGSKELLGLPARYGNPISSEIGILEAYAQADSDYGRFRFGFVPIPFGLEGGDAERRLRFPRSLTFEKRFVNLRDFGVSYRIASEGFFTEWAIHNGEGGPDLDGEGWFTARWGWQGARFLRVGISGSAGRTTPKSTNPAGVSTSAIAGLDVDKTAKIIIANGFVQWDANPVRVSLESTAGDTRQDDTVIKFRELHADVEVNGGSSTAYMLRYDTIDPRSDLPSDQITEFTGGVAWKSRYENSVLYLLGTKRIQQDVAQDVHRVMILWRITPSATSLQSAL